MTFEKEQKKKCPSCGEILSFNAFYKNSARKDGLASVCKRCAKKYKEEWRNSESGREKHNAQFLRWKSMNPEKYIASARRAEEKRKSRNTEEKSIVCYICGRRGGEELFPKSRLLRGGGNCRICQKDIRKKQRQKYNRIPKEDFMKFSFELFLTQKRSCKEREHNPPEYNIKELRAWLKTQKKLEEMLTTWAKSAYTRKHKPTIDRINPFKTYNLENIQLMTVRENCAKARTDLAKVYSLVKEKYNEDPAFKTQIDNLFRRINEI